MIGVLAAVALQAVTWPADVEPMGWTWSGATDGMDMIVYLKDGPRPNMAWMRAEYETPQNGNLSSMVLYTVDCEIASYTTMQRSSYVGRNLGGTAVTNANTEQRQFAGPGTFGETIVNWVCGRQ